MGGDLVHRLATALVLLGAMLLTCSGCSGGKSVADSEANKPQLAPWYSISGMFPATSKSQFEESIPADPKLAANLVAHGGYLVESVAACGFCHGDPQSSGVVLSGGRSIEDPSGTGASPNITPDLETGIGAWTVDQIITAFRANKRPDDTPLSNYVHEGYRWMSNKDARAIAVYLLSLQPVEQAIPRTEGRKLGLFVRRPSVSGYVPETPDLQPTVGFGRYLTHSVAGCQRCHSPRDGSQDPDEMLRGGSAGKKKSIWKRVSTILSSDEEVKKVSTPGELLSDLAKDRLSLEDTQLVDSQIKEATQTAVGNHQSPGSRVIPPDAPNIRGSEGLVDWDSSDIIAFLKSGKKPNGAAASSEDCPWNYYTSLSSKDLQAIAAYLKSL